MSDEPSVERNDRVRAEFRERLATWGVAESIERARKQGSALSREDYEDLVAAALIVKAEIGGTVRIVDDRVDVTLPADMSDADLTAAADKVAALGLPPTVRVGLTRAGR